MTVQELGPLQTAWVEALESGKYEQGTLWLKADGKYCCLGVLCELAGLAYNETTAVFTDGEEPQTDVLPQSLVDRIGLRDKSGSFRKGAEDDGPSTLICLNDDDGFTFKQIAEFIRSDPSNVFAKAA